MKRLLFLAFCMAVVLLLSGCACQSTYFRSCGRMTIDEMCRKDAACRACLKDGEDAETCWRRVNGDPDAAVR